MTAWNVIVVIGLLFMGVMFAYNAIKMYNLVRHMEKNRFDLYVGLVMWTMGVVAVLYFEFAYLVTILDWRVTLPISF